MTPTPLSKPAAWMCEFVREDGSTDTQVVLDDPEGTRWADVADGDGVSQYRVTPLYVQPVSQLGALCRKCGGAMAPGKAIAQTYSAGSPDFPGDTVGMTMSAAGPGKLVDCLKCSACGWSVSQPGEALPAEPPKSDKSYALVAVGEINKTALPGCVKPDTDKQVFFYEQDFYVLSNFSAFNLVWKRNVFPTSEHAYHWEKFGGYVNSDGVAMASCFDLRDEIRTAPSAHEAFKIAERNKDMRRPDWDTVKVEMMRDILRAKARQHEYVRRKLLATGDRELIEDSWRDDYWGWGPNRDGKNMLGKLWMEVRTELRASEARVEPVERSSSEPAKQDKAILPAASASPVEAVEVLTKDEIAVIVEALAPDHDGRDFEAECPGCTAYKKLTANGGSVAQPPQAVQEDERDAKRYRWLRDNATREGRGYRLAEVGTDQKDISPLKYRWFVDSKDLGTETLDAAVDAAMKGTQ